MSDCCLSLPLCSSLIAHEASGAALNVPFLRVPCACSCVCACVRMRLCVRVSVCVCFSAGADPFLKDRLGQSPLVSFRVSHPVYICTNTL